MTLTETGQSVTRPVIYDIIGQIRHITKINPDSKIHYPGDIERMYTPGSELGQTDKTAHFNTTNYVYIDVEEDYDKDRIGSTTTTRSEQIPIFLDPKLQVAVVPIYATSQVTINFKYRCPSKSEANRWRDDMRIRVSQMRDVNLHSVTYHYPLPTEVLGVLKTVYGLRELYRGYGESFDEWVLSNASDRLTVVTDQIGNFSQVAVSETQSRIVGLFDIDTIPDKAEREEAGIWTISFGYKFSYEKPIAVHLKYPVMVHNNLMPAEYTIFDGVTNLDRKSLSRGTSFSALQIFEVDSLMTGLMEEDSLVRIPSFDDFRIVSAPVGTGTTFIALTEVDTQDSKTLLNLRELGDIVLKRSILNFIRDSEYTYVSQIYKSVINLSLYRNQYLTSSGNIICDKNLTLTSKDVLDLRNQHRVRFGIVTDLALLDPKALERLRKYKDPDDPDNKYPTALVEILRSVNEIFNYIREDWYTRPIPEYGIRKVVDYFRDITVRGTTDWRDLFPTLTTAQIENFRLQYIGRKTVMTTSVIAIDEQKLE
jgi:hypothetical protein